MAKTTAPPPEEIRSCLGYNPTTGKIVYLRRAVGGGRVIHPGDEAGGRSGRYIHVSFRGVAYQAHRLAWYFMTGDWLPLKQDIDHINGDGADNRWLNLRLATRSQNVTNPSNKLRSDNQSGFHGVTLRKDSHKWRAHITVDGKRIFLGDFADKNDAIAARLAAEPIYHGDQADSKWHNQKLTALQRKRSNRLTTLHAHNTTGHRGVYWYSQRWYAAIKVNGKRIHLGCFTKKTDAIAARLRAEKEMT